MSKLISEEIVEAITLGDKEGFMSAFHSALAAKVSDALEIKKVEIASTLIAPASSEVVEEEVEQIDEAAKPDAKELKVTFGRGHSGQPGGEGQADKVTTHHGNGLTVTSKMGWDNDHHIDVHHNKQHVGGIFSTHGSEPDYMKNEKYKGDIGHKEVKAAMAAHQKHPEVQSWLIHNHSDSESEADTGTINGHKLHPTAKKYLEKISNDDDRDYEAPYKPQTKSAAKPKSASKASTSGAYEKALAALKKKHGINEEVEQIDELNAGEGSILDRATKAASSKYDTKDIYHNGPGSRKAKKAHLRMRGLENKLARANYAANASQEKGTPYADEYVSLNKRKKELEAAYDRGNAKQKELMAPYYAKIADKKAANKAAKMAKEEVEQVDEATPEAKGQSRAEWRMGTADVIAKNNAKIADRKARAKKKLMSMSIPAGKGK